MEKIDSHSRKKIMQKISNWYRGKWVVDTCACGTKMLVPIGKKGKYRCNSCAGPSEEDGPCSENNDNLGESPDY